MRGTTVTLITVAMLCMVGVSFSQLAGEEMSEADIQAKTAEYMKANQAGPEHERLAKLEGDWELTITFWGAPGAEPMTSAAKGSSKMVMGGKFLRTETSGEMMGMPVETMNMIGFDGRYGHFSYVGFDNMGTYWVSAFGKLNEANNTIEMSGTDEDPIFEFTQIYDINIELVDENQYVTRVIFKDDVHTEGKVDEFKAVEVVAKRVK